MAKNLNYYLNVVDLARKDDDVKRFFIKLVDDRISYFKHLRKEWIEKKKRSLNVFETEIDMLTKMKERIYKQNHSPDLPILQSMVRNFDRCESEEDFAYAKALIIFEASRASYKLGLDADKEKIPSASNEFVKKLKNIEKRQIKLQEDLDRLIDEYNEILDIGTIRNQRIYKIHSPILRLIEKFSRPRPRGGTKDKRLIVVVDKSANIFTHFSTKSLKTKGGSFETFAQGMLEIISGDSVAETSLQRTITRLKPDRVYRDELSKEEEEWAECQKAKKKVSQCDGNSNNPVRVWSRGKISRFR